MAIDAKLEASFVEACSDGSVEQCHKCLLQLSALANERERQHLVHELIGYGFSIAARLEHVDVMDLIMTLQPDVLAHGVCTTPHYFPPYNPQEKYAASQLPTWQFCHAFRYVAYAALMATETNAIQSVRYLVQNRKYLFDFELEKCMQLAVDKASIVQPTAASSSVLATAMHPIIMLLLKEHSFLLRQLAPSALKDRQYGFQETVKAALRYSYELNR